MMELMSMVAELTRKSNKRGYTLIFSKFVRNEPIKFLEFIVNSKWLYLFGGDVNSMFSQKGYTLIFSMFDGNEPIKFLEFIFNGF